MLDNSEIDELPKGWIAKEFEITGQSRLYAVFKQQDTEKQVQIVPYRTEGLSGLKNSHRVTIETSESGLEVVAEGTDVEHADEAKEVAIELMESMGDSTDH